MSDHDDPTEPPDDESGLTGMLGRAGAATGRLALKPVRAVASAGKDALNEEAERAIDGVMAGPLPEAVGRSIVEHRVVERLVTSALESKPGAEEGAAAAHVDMAPVEDFVKRALANPALARMLTETVHSELTTDLADQIVKSPAFKRTLTSVLSSPEVRHALERQATGFGAEMAAAIRRRSRRVDGAIEAKARALVRRPRPAGETVPYAGLATRGVGFVTDAAVINLVVLVGGALIGLVASLFGELKPKWLVGTLAGFGWLIVVGLYFTLFWSTIGQTPGMRLMRIRVLRGGRPPAPWRSAVRLVGLPLAVIPMFAGFLPVLWDAQRRALPDYMAGTAVEYDFDPLTEPEPAAHPVGTMPQPQA